jgi:hypothetical protein
LTLKHAAFSVIIAFVLTISGCKDDAVTENNNNNNNQDPTAPQLLEPLNNSTTVSLNPVLKWAAFPNASGYRVQLSLDANFIGTMFEDSSLSATEITISSSLPSTNVYYYWRVIAQLQGGGFSEWSAVWRFTVVLSPPQPPNLILPPNNSVDQHFLPLFDWDDPATAETYRVQVSQNQNFTPVLFDTSGIQLSQLQCPPLYLNTNTQYYWRVKAANSGGLSVSDWSSVFTFTTISGPEPNSISGTITFVDTNFLILPSHYTAGAFQTSNWPPSIPSPYRFDSLTIQQSGNTYIANYKIRHLPDGNYYITTSPRRGTEFVGSILGVLGCDTNRTIYSSCAYTPQKVTISGSVGVVNINFLSWADSTQVIF